MMRSETWYLSVRSTSLDDLSSVNIQKDHMIQATDLKNISLFNNQNTTIFASALGAQVETRMNLDFDLKHSDPLSPFVF